MYCLESVDYCLVLLQKLYTEEVFLSWFDRLAEDKVIPNYPYLRRKAQTATPHDLQSEE